ERGDRSREGDHFAVEAILVQFVERAAFGRRDEQILRRRNVGDHRDPGAKERRPFARIRSGGGDRVDISGSGPIGRSQKYLAIGIREKYLASATIASAPFSSLALQPSVCVLMMIVSSLLPGSTAHRLSAGMSG